MSGWILVLLPVAVGLFMTSMNPGYLDPLFHDSIGRIILAITVVMEIIGAVVINRIVDIDV
jgi:tight adherence protein B